jgi:YVTN family beta-propeller protein
MTRSGALRPARLLAALTALVLGTVALLAPSAGAATTTLTVVATIPTPGANLPWAPVYNPATHRLYTITTSTGEVSVIDTSTNTFVTNVFVGTSTSLFPTLAFNPTNNWVYAPSNVANTISVIDGGTNAIIHTWAMPAGAAATSVAVDPATNTLFVGGDGTTLYLFNAKTGAAKGTVTVGSDPASIGVDTSNDTEYVGNFLDNSITVVHAGAVVTTIPLVDRPTSVTVNPVTHKIYVAIRDQDEVAVINGATNTVTATIPTGTSSGPWGGAVNTATNTIYIVDSFESSLAVIDGATDTVTQTFTISGSGIIGAAVNEASDIVYASNGFGHSVSVIQVTTSPTITSKAPSGLVKGKSFSHTVTASGTKPITFSVSAGSLPSGLSLKASTGVISGKPTATGSFTFTIKATNSAGSDTATYTVVVAAPTATTSASASSSVGATDSNAATPTAVDAGYAGPATRNDDLGVSVGVLGAVGLLSAGGLVLVGRRRGRHG